MCRFPLLIMATIQSIKARSIFGRGVTTPLWRCCDICAVFGLTMWFASRGIQCCGSWIWAKIRMEMIVRVEDFLYVVL